MYRSLFLTNLQTAGLQLNLKETLKKRPQHRWYFYVNFLKFWKITFFAEHLRKTALKDNTAWKVPVFGVLLVRIFPHSNWMRRDTQYLSVLSPKSGKYGPENSEYEHFSRSVMLIFSVYSKTIRWHNWSW